ncbi:MAG: transcriptional repressor [Pseudobutyrivibrio sp.]|nr:transcriptional repressor [Pseudobutyrivibrio sp.]
MNYSRQRESIKQYLMSTKEHPTAEIIYQHVKEDYPKISLATVYRNLTLLVDSGEALKISTGDGTDHYDGNTTEHGHYYCKCCHKLIDLDIAPTTGQILAASSEVLGTIETASLMFTGVCKDCIINEEK